MIEGVNCPNCGAPAENAGAKICQYCETPFLLVSANKLKNISDSSLGKYTDFYKKITKDDPDFLQCQISLVLVYLKRKLNPLAENLSKKLLEEYPDEEDSYLWRSLALIKNDDIRKLNLSTAKEISQMLQVGNNLANDDQKQNFFKIAIFLKENYFDNHGILTPDSLKEIIQISELEYIEDSLIQSILET